MTATIMQNKSRFMKGGGNILQEDYFGLHGFICVFI